MNILILNQDEVETLLTMEACISVMAEAMAALARGHVYQPMRMMVRPPSAAGIMALMPSYMASTAGQAFYTGELLSLMSGSAITAIRTAAVSGLATRLLGRPDADDLAIIGSGVQARSHLAAIHCVRPLKRVRVASRTVDHARKFADELGPHFPFPIESVAAIEEAVHGADLIVTATTTSTPIIKREWIAPGAHLNVIGAYTPTTREVDSAIIAAACLFVDSRESALSEAGDVLLAIQEGAIDAGHIRAEIGEVLIGSQPGRTTDEEITLFKSLGLPVEDLAVAEYLYRRALEMARGTIVPF